MCTLIILCVYRPMFRRTFGHASAVRQCVCVFVCVYEDVLSVDEV